MIEKIKELRFRTNLPLGECKSSLEESNGDIEEAILILKKRGLLSAAKKASRETQAGKIASYVHNGKIAVLVEVNCESDFVAKNELFMNFCDMLAMQIAAMNPEYLSSDSIPNDILDKQISIFHVQVPLTVPDNRVQFVIDGKLKKWFTEVCLLDQKPVSDTKAKNIEQLRAELVMKLGENIVIKRFVRWELNV